MENIQINEKDEEKEIDPQKSETQILTHTEEAGLTQLNRKTIGLMLSGFSAGLDIGFSVLLMMVAHASFSGLLPEPFVKFIVANMYPIGFMLVILGRSELFTEHTTLAVFPVLQGLASLKKLFRLWILVFLSNIAGGLIFALILSYLSGSLQFLEKSSIHHINLEFLNYPWQTLLLSAALAGWLMGLLVWLLAASRETISQIIIIWIITTSIGVAGLSHCIVGNIEMAVDLFNRNISFEQYFRFLGLTTLGNAIGGVFFVAIIKFSKSRHSGEEKKVDIEKLK